MSAELLISEVQKHPSLWNLNDPQYHNRLMSDRLWTSVADELDITKDNAKTKWRNLRNTFNREFKKISKPRSGCSAEDEPVYNGKWSFFMSMMFLKDMATPRETQSNLLNADLTDVDGITMDETLGEDLESQVIIVPCANIEKTTAPGGTQKLLKKRSNDSVCVTPDSVRPTKIKKKGMSESEIQLLKNEKEKLNALEEPEDDDLYFFKSLTRYFKQMTPLKKLKVRAKIQQVVIDELTVWPSSSSSSNSAGSTPVSNVQNYNYGTDFLHY